MTGPIRNRTQPLRASQTHTGLGRRQMARVAYAERPAVSSGHVTGPSGLTFQAIQFPFFSPTHRIPRQIKGHQNDVALRDAIDDKRSLKGLIDAFQTKAGDRLNWNSFVRHESDRLANHIAWGHLDPYEFQRLGVTRFDLERAEYLGCDLTSLVEGPLHGYPCLMDLLRMSPEELRDRFYYLNPIRANMSSDQKRHKMSVGEFRQWVIKTLRFMDQLGVAQINWDDVELLYPGAQLVEFDVNQDSGDYSFFDPVGDAGIDSLFQKDNCFVDPKFSPTVNIPRRLTQPVDRVTIDRAYEDKKHLYTLAALGADPRRSESGAQMSRHIFEVHFYPLEIESIGLPLYDIERSAWMGLSLQDLVDGEQDSETLMDLICMTPYELRDKFSLLDVVTEDSSWNHIRFAMPVAEFRQWIIKLMKCLELYRLATIDWETVESVYPHAKQVELDLNRDTRDISFFRSMRNTLYDQYFTKPEFMDWRSSFLQ